MEIVEVQGQTQVQIETGLDASDVENMIVLPRTVQTGKKQKKTTHPKCTNSWTNKDMTMHQNCSL